MYSENVIHFTILCTIFWRVCVGRGGGIDDVKLCTCITFTCIVNPPRMRLLFKYFRYFSPYYNDQTIRYRSFDLLIMKTLDTGETDLTSSIVKYSVLTGGPMQWKTPQ